MNTIRTEVEEEIAWITFDRPEVRNAVSLEMVEELTHLLDQYKQDAQVKVIVFTGANNVFVSGGDLDQLMRAKGKEEAFLLLSKIGEVLEKIDRYPKPTIAMINGAAIGGGCELAISCHFRFAADTAIMGFVQISMHITTGWGGGSRLLDKLNETDALTLLLTGKRIDAAEAMRLGFVQEVYPKEQLKEAVHSFASRIAEQPLVGIESYMRLLEWKRSGMSKDERVNREIEQCASLWGSDEHTAVVQRFLHKR
ncbi:enoyl-CoA hydratase/isomerase family protein [Brevibacillus sp. SYSU BS000544]|uniref:enoyl-CoA hydratase/isomerase family protein n=1 Tax=Brevibacillus sp. SYSU BS000544 TaxID=3416443 RepID=UPI003CE54173